MFWNCMQSCRFARILDRIDEKEPILENQNENNQRSYQWRKKSLKSVKSQKLLKTSSQARISVQKIKKFNHEEGLGSKNLKTSTRDSLPCQFQQNFQTKNKIEKIQFQQSTTYPTLTSYPTAFDIKNQPKITFRFSQFGETPRQEVQLFSISSKRLTVPSTTNEKPIHIENIRSTDSVIIEQKCDMRSTHAEEMNQNKQLLQGSWQRPKSTVSIDTHRDISDSIVVQRSISLLSRFAQLL